MTFVFYVSRPIFFENQCGSAEKTNKPPKNKHSTSQRKCEMWWSRSVRQRYTDGTIDKKQLISNRPPSCKAAKKTTTKDVHLSRSFLPLFRDCSPSLSPDRGSERGLTDMANKHAQESDWAMVGPPGPSSLSRSTFCPQQRSHTKKLF